MTAAFVFGCALVFAPRLALAQPAAAPPPPPPPPHHEGSADFAFVSTTGNAPTQTLGLGAEFIVRPDAWTLRAKTGFVQNETDNVVNARAFTFLFRGSRLLRPRVSLYGQYDYLRNTFAGIANRNALEAGLSWQAIEPNRHALRLDGGIGYASEQRTVGSDESNGVVTFGAAYKLKLSSSADLSDEGRAILSMADANQWRGENIVALSAKLTTLLSLKVSHTLRYVNEPRPDSRRATRSPRWRWSPSSESFPPYAPAHPSTRRTEMFKEFKEFAMKGSVMDLAIGVVIGVAFGAIVNSMVADVIMPVVGFITGGVDFANMFAVLKAGTSATAYATLAAAKADGAVTLNYGVFLNAVVNFLDHRDGAVPRRQGDQLRSPQGRGRTGSRRPRPRQPRNSSARSATASGRAGRFVSARRRSPSRRVRRHRARRWP